MATYKIGLKLDGTALNLTDDDYKIDYKNIDTINTSEAGTNLRSATRLGVKEMTIAYKCIETELSTLRTANEKSYITATYYDEKTSQDKTWRCYMSGYKESLILEDNSHRYYKVSFKLVDLEN